MSAINQLKTRVFELKFIIENISLELEFNDMTEAEAEERLEDLKQAQAELMKLTNK